MKHKQSASVQFSPFIKEIEEPLRKSFAYNKVDTEGLATNENVVFVSKRKSCLVMHKRGSSLKNLETLIEVERTES